MKRVSSKKGLQPVLSLRPRFPLSLMARSVKCISETLEKKVIQTVRKMGYQPNQLAVILRTDKSIILGLVVESISGRFFAFLAKVIEEEAEKHGYRPVYCSTALGG